MASGWWKSTTANLGEVSPVDFEVATSLEAPRGFPKLASIATGAGLFLGGTPAVSVDGVIYYAGDDYTQNTDKPSLNRYDGRVHTTILELPYITGTTPSKAILSLCENEGYIYISTWDSGTTSSDFAGRVYALTPSGTLNRIDEGQFTSGKLPYAMAWFNNALYVGVTKQNPASTTEVIKIRAVNGVLPTAPTVSASFVAGSTTWYYRIGALNGPPSTGSFIYRSNITSVTNRSVIDGTYYNTLSWNNPGGATASYRVERSDGPVWNVIADISDAATTSYNDNGTDNSGGAGQDANETVAITLTLGTSAATTTTYKVGAVVGSHEFISNAVSATTYATLDSQSYVSLSWSAVSGATSYRVYRTAGGGSQGLITTTTSTSLNDTGYVASGSVPSPTTSIALTSGAVGCLVVYGDSLYVGSYQPAGTFGKVFKITTGDVLSTSTTAAPGGTAQAYNGYTAGFVFNNNLYMGYWNDDATDVCEIHKYTGSAWSTVKTISGAGARPWMCFAEAAATAYAYGGGDAKTGILYNSSDGATWTDQSALLPSSKEAIPFIGSANVIGGF